jgi:Secretion system C-terminal sorting domain
MAQTTILDFEAPATSTTFQFFGSTLEGALSTVIANPNPTGANTSSKVARFVKPAVAEVYAGGFTNPNPTTPISFVSDKKLSIKVHMDHIGVVLIKLEDSPNGGSNWERSVVNTKINEWEELVFDATLPGLVDPFTPAAGFIYKRMVVFVDFGTKGTGTEVITYLDDAVTKPGSAVATTNILDFEAPATTTEFEYFGSAFNGAKTPVIANPNPTGINTSPKVSEYKKSGVSEVWAGAFANPAPLKPITLTANSQVCADVHMDHIGNLAIKLEGSTSAKPDWITKVANTKINAWEKLCFDASSPSLEGTFASASGTYTKLAIFFDFGKAGTGTDVTSYLDNVLVKESAAPVNRTVNLQVDMNKYAPNFTKVYISGTFNSWSADANELTDANQDGIFVGSISVPNGTYEYKIQLDKWAAQEEFIGTEECVKLDPTGAFKNRLLVVGADTDLPKFCFNSCYACGEEVKIIFKLGMNGVTPNADGVWLAGGGNFDAPGGRYKMKGPTNGIYELIVPRKRGFKSFYAFANGPCADYSCKEDLTGKSCGVASNFNDRFMPDVTKDTIVATCFGGCFTNALCTSGTDSPVQDAKLFQLLGNPAQNNVTTLSFGGDIATEKQVDVTNTLGQVVHTFMVQAGEAQVVLPLDQISAGIYFVTVRTENRYFTRSLVK